MTAEHREIIESVRREREEDARFFSSKPEMERWVAGEFLTRLGVSFHPDEMISRPENDNVDVVFRDANFQIKEIYDPAERRGDEVRELLKLAREAVTLDDLYPPAAARDLVVSDLAELIRCEAESVKYPPRERAELDLLCYVTRTYCGFNQPPATVGGMLSGLGWRSISCLLGQRAYVLTSAPAAPEFLGGGDPAAKPSLERSRRTRRSAQ